MAATNSNSASSINVTRAALQDLSLAINPVKFARKLGFNPNPWQADFLLSTHPRIIMNCPRGAGKSILTAVIALHHALYMPNAFILMFSKSERQSMELFKKTIDFYKLLETDLSLSPKAESAHRLELKNGSRILSLPSSTETIVGYHDVTLLIIDEAALVKDELYQRARPMLHHQTGRLILLSTPFGRRGFFYEEWRDFETNPDTVWHGITVTTDDCPHMSPEFLAEERVKLGERVYRSEYECSFESDATAMFKEEWLMFYDPDPQRGQVPKIFDVMIQSWDPTSTKTLQSDYCVGQVWGRKGASIYLLDQVRGRWDFDEIVAQIRALSDKWPDARAKIIEAQSIGAGLSSHLRNLDIPGVIPIPAVGKKEMRALSITPYFQARNVYLPSPEEQPWMKDYLNELLNFPNVANDDCVDATSQAINKLHDTLYDGTSEIVADTAEGAIHPEDNYRIGWIPARLEEFGVLVVYNVDHGSIVHFQRTKYESMKDQIDRAFQTAQRYNAAVWALAGIDEAMLKALARRGAAVRRVEMTEQRWTSAYENLSLLISYKQIKIPNDPELLAQLEVFKSETRLDGRPDYSYQAGQNSAVRGLCLVTYNVYPDIEAATYDLDEGDEGNVHSWFEHGGGGEEYYKKIDLDDYGDEDDDFEY